MCSQSDFLRFWGVFVLESVFGFSFEAPEVPFLVSPKIAISITSGKLFGHSSVSTLMTWTCDFFVIFLMTGSLSKLLNGDLSRVSHIHVLLLPTSLLPNAQCSIKSMHNAVCHTDMQCVTVQYHQICALHCFVQISPVG